MNYHFKTLLINLNRSQDRLTHCTEQLQSAEIHFERIEAVDGEMLTQSAERSRFNADLNQQNYHKNLNSGEIGCYLSHRKVWQKIVDEKLDFAIVLEDDFSLTGDLTAAIEVAKSSFKQWDYIKLAGHRRNRYPIHQQEIADMQLVTYNKLPSQTCAQIVSFNGAKKLLAHSETFGRPVDVDIQHWWEADLLAFGLMPYVVTANNQFGSEIDRVAKRKQARTRRLQKIKLQFQFWRMNKKQNKQRLRSLMAG
ncbi:glycosyltransferase family 25 protein [Alteromonadaceae bacterium BrNp21-10]|nr:glycosyltransferase family 25 protein [Alteromonadaceae bacterium BrNp21-10]